MDTNLSAWQPDDPEQRACIAALAKQEARRLVKLAKELPGDDAGIMLDRVVRILEKARDPLEQERLHRSRLAAAPDPPGVDWLLEKPERMDKALTECWRRWRRAPVAYEATMDTWCSQVSDVARKTRRGAPAFDHLTRGRWRRGEEPVDRGIVAAALKLVHVESAHELIRA